MIIVSHVYPKLGGTHSDEIKRIVALNKTMCFSWFVHYRKIWYNVRTQLNEIYKIGLAVDILIQKCCVPPGLVIWSYLVLHGLVCALVWFMVLSASLWFCMLYVCMSGHLVWSALFLFILV